MNCYEFIFIDEDGEKVLKEIWEECESNAWDTADAYAYYNEYVDYYLKED